MRATSRSLPSNAGSTERRPRTSASSTRPTGGSDSAAAVAPRHDGPPPPGTDRPAFLEARAGCADGACSPTRAPPRPHRVEPGRRHRRTAARQQRERSEVHREGPIGEALLQGHAHEALGPSRDALLRDGRPQHVLEEGLAATLAHRPCAGRRVQGEAAAPDRAFAPRRLSAFLLARHRAVRELEGRRGKRRISVLPGPGAASPRHRSLS